MQMAVEELAWRMEKASRSETLGDHNTEDYTSHLAQHIVRFVC